MIERKVFDHQAVTTILQTPSTHSVESFLSFSLFVINAAKGSLHIHVEHASLRAPGPGRNESKTFKKLLSDGPVRSLNVRGQNGHAQDNLRGGEVLCPEHMCLGALYPV